MAIGDNVKKLTEQFEGNKGGESSAPPAVEALGYREINSIINSINNSPAATATTTTTTPATATPVSLVHTPSSRSNNIHNNFENSGLVKPYYKRSTSKTNNRATSDDYEYHDWTRTSLGGGRIKMSWIAIGLGIFCLIQFIILIALVVIILTKGNDDGGQSAGKISSSKVISGPVAPGSVMFQDDFDALNLKSWRHDRYMTDDGFVIFGSNSRNSYVEDGVLFIEPTFTEQEFNNSFLLGGRVIMGKTLEPKCTSFIPSQCDRTGRGSTYLLNPIMSASIRTSQSFYFQYGIVEMRAKMPKGDWISTEISLMPRYEYYGEPSDTSRIVLLTTRGNERWDAANGTKYGNQMVCSQLVYSDLQSQVRTDMVQHCHVSEPGDGFAEDFHTYRFEWSADLFKIFVDDKLKGKFIANTFVSSRFSDQRHVVMSDNAEEQSNRSSFEKEFYIQMKVTVGTGFPDIGYTSNFRKPWNNKRPEGPSNFWYARRQWETTWSNRSSALQVDYVKVVAL